MVVPPDPLTPLKGRVPLHAKAGAPEGTRDRSGLEPQLQADQLGEVFRYAPLISGDDFVLLDPLNLRFLDCNLSAHARLGYSREDFLALDPLELQANPSENRAWLQNLAEHMLKQRHGSFATHHRSRSRKVRELMVRYLRVDVGERPVILLAFLDRTDQHQTERELIRVNQLLNEAERLSHIGSWELIHGTGQLIWSEETARIFEQEPSRLPQNFEALLGLIHPDDRDSVHRLFEQSLLNGQPLRIEHRVAFADGREKQLLQRGVTTYDHRGWPVNTVGTVQDVTALHTLEQRLEEAAFLDSLTGLPNKAATERHLQQLLQQRPYNEAIAVVDLDLDHFDSVNETFGPETGNQVLCALADRLRALLEPDDWVARLGSDEFVVIRRRGIHSVSSAISLGRWLQDKVATGRALGQQVSVRPTVCVGVCTCPEHGSDAHGLLQSANTALMEAKRRGRNQLQAYSTTVSQRLRDRLEMESQLDLAVERQQLRLLYQPQVDGQGRLMGAEALLRWTTHQGQAVRPDQFIPLAEQSGQIHRIGTWVIETACSQIQRWRQQGLVVPPIAVNVSAVQLEPRKPGLLEQMQAILKNYGVEPQELELEITETALFTYREQAVAQLRDICAAGFSLALDDFGTGYSSLEMLHELQLHTLKIDRCFVDRLGSASPDEAIVRTTIRMAEELGMHSLAEGVETEQQWQILRDLGCEFFQGYLFDRPLDASDFAARLKGSQMLAPRPPG
ncbi:MAG: EAL domain-containing protein [Synechococcus sp.]|nr:EAL domain-containing protein [Synechococcus sp.]